MIVDFKKYSSVRIGEAFEVEILDTKREFKGFVVGGANNLLVSPSPKKLALLGKEFDFIEVMEQNSSSCTLKIGCACNAKKIYLFAKKHNLAGFEFLGKIPGLLGGLLKMNAGLKDENISKNLISINTANKELLKQDCAFSYRCCGVKEVMFEAIFKLEYGFDEKKDEALKQARNNQPNGASFGSIFKNPKDDFAGRLIEAVGLKGFKKGDAMISQKHANFLINTKNASFEDALFLIELAQKRVFEEFGIHLEKEVILI
ncbi:UDP-N-acetylmuramate dehydrogenase [Campylobacter sp. MIT 12-8780]|uniref:UDP-N-acetylmuramate dehydrogenase n=1 Tax=unclassified Campylobacter TaxID=2593542 RepID=UPI00115DB46E|nr:MULTISPECIES: UDP-N-acetylmuramate dehydrogenase [unclassified Campylobacter]NDJ26831.1 UDP-N-acetylmuramate dehydrogenase [Campylobacter sp. MIT 19-121]TQR42351.1 UDP-N-acetylmuramate dehydrogenase [Campylobacter sp. MIT 12-8780]